MDYGMWIFVLLLVSLCLCASVVKTNHRDTETQRKAPQVTRTCGARLYIRLAVLSYFYSAAVSSSLSADFFASSASCSGVM